jgi:hypothetical protein
VHAWDAAYRKGAVPARAIVLRVRGVLVLRLLSLDGHDQRTYTTLGAIEPVWDRR